METEDKPGVAMDPNVLFQTYKSCSQFYVVREHSRWGQVTAQTLNTVTDNNVIVVLILISFCVTLIYQWPL